MKESFLRKSNFWWGIWWVVEGKKLDHYLTLNSLAQWVGKGVGIIYIWTKSEHRIHGIWNLERNNSTCEQEVGINLLMCSTKYLYHLRIWGQKMSLMAPKNGHHSWNHYGKSFWFFISSPQWKNHEWSNGLKKKV